MRAILDANNNVTSVDYFVSGVTTCVDVATGPDGALYYIGVIGGTVYRLAYNASAQNLIVSPTAMNILEGGGGVFTVRLATQPAANVSVTVSRASGDTDINISSSPTLTFTPGNYSTPQIVSVTAAQDPDTVNDSAVLSVASAGLASQLITVNAVDDDDGLLLSTSALTINEASSGTFTVRLTSQPAVNVTVNVARTAGDTDITVAGGASLTFTPSNYATPRSVTIAAAADPDTVDDVATITVTSPGLAPHTVSVTAKDTSGLAPGITSTPVTTAIVGANYNYDVNATGIPAPTYSLSTPPSGMTINAASGLISWIPTATGNFNVTVMAMNGIAPNATQTYTITVSPDLPPIARLTEPANGAVVSGQNAEFFGDGIDDVATVKAEFYVDGVLSYTDINSNNHFHFGGAHNLWDTTQLTDGSHDLRFVVYDTKGQTGSATVSVMVSNSSLPNQPPAVSLSSPADNSIYTAPASIPLTANAADSDGTISKVEFFQGTTLLTTVTNSPFTFDWTGVGVGSYSLTAKATDNLTAAATSIPVNITVNPASVSTTLVTSYVQGTLRNDFNGWLGMKITVGASPITVTSLGRMFYTGNNGTHSLKVVFASNGADVPGGGASLNMSGGTAGQFKYALLSGLTLAANTSYYVVSLEASGGDKWATDNTQVTPTTAATCDGAILSKPGGWTFRLPANTTFGPVNLVYTTGSSPPPNAPPTVSLSSPANNATFTAPANITLNANASDSDGTVTQVDFYVGTTWLGTDLTSPYSFAWNNVGAGVYGLTATARDNAGTVSTSAVVNVTINQPPVVSLSSPANNATFTAPANITLTATASDSDGTVSKVDFFSGPSLLATASHQPVQFCLEQCPGRQL